MTMLMMINHHYMRQPILLLSIPECVVFVFDYISTGQCPFTFSFSIRFHLVNS